MLINISQNIRNNRVARKWSQEYLAEKLGVSFQAVSKWERGESYPDLQIVPDIAELFHISTDELLGADKTREKEEVNSIIEGLRKLDTERNDVEIVRLAEEALKRFPNNCTLMAWIVYAGQNVDPHRSVDLADHVLENCVDGYIRNWVQTERCYALCKCGEKGKAIEAAKRLPNYDNTRDSVLIDLLDGEAALRYISSYPMQTLCQRFDRMIKKLMPYYEWRQQIKLLEKSIGISELLWESGDVSFVLPRQIDNHLMIAELYLEHKEYENGLKYVKRAVELAVFHDSLPQPGKSKAVILNSPKYKNNEVCTPADMREQRARVRNWLESVKLLGKDGSDYNGLLNKLK